MIIDTNNNTADQTNKKVTKQKTSIWRPKRPFPYSTLASKCNEIGLSKIHCTFSTQDLSWWCRLQEYKKGLLKE